MNGQKRWISLVVAIVLAFSMLAGTVTAQDDYATREYTVNEFILSIGKNNIEGQAADLLQFKDYDQINSEYAEALALAVGMGYLKGYEDRTLRPKDEIKRVEALAILSRALPEAPVVNPDATFTDIPDWAVEDINRLAKAGIVLGYGDGTFGAEDLITVEQVGLLAQRIDAQVDKVRLQDDYYAAVNSRFLKNESPANGQLEVSTMANMSEDAFYDLVAVMEDILGSAEAQVHGTPEQQIQDFFYNIYDMNKRNIIGVTPLLPYILAIEDAGSVSELMQVLAAVEMECAIYPIHYFEVSEDAENSSVYALYYGTGDYGLSKEEMAADEDAEISQAYIAFLTTLFNLAGYGDAESEAKAQNVYHMQKELASVAMDSGATVDQTYNVYSMADFKKLMSNGYVEEYLNNVYYQNVESVIVSDVELAKKMNSYLTQDNLPLLKDYSISILLRDASGYLSRDFYEAQETFYNERFGVDSQMNDISIAVNYTQSYLGWPLGEMYVQRYFSEDAKQEVTLLVEEIIETYEKRLNEVDWLSDATKQKAIEKLAAIDKKIGYPEQWPNLFDYVDIRGNDGSAATNIWAINTLAKNSWRGMVGQEVGEPGWGLYPQSVNAYYSPVANEIVLPAAILQAPLFDPDAPEEQNLGGIGTIIAHEISHAFDINGSQFDKDGNMNNWWTDADRQAYETRCDQLVELFNSAEVLPGRFVDGELTLGENIADLGGVACVLDIATSRENADLDLLFRSYANVWATVSTEAYQILNLSTDVHAPAKQRVNVILPNFQVFYDTYGITESDGMYLPPEERIVIW